MEATTDDSMITEIKDQLRTLVITMLLNADERRLWRVVDILREE